MPEPEELSIDFSEPSEADLEEEAGFNTEEGLDEEEAEKPVEEDKTSSMHTKEEDKSETAEETTGDPDEVKEEEPVGEEAGGGEPSESESARAIAEQRAKELLESRGAKAEEKEPEPTVPVSEPEPSKEKAQKMTKEVVARLLKKIDLDELPDDEVVIGNTSINFREMAEDDPEAFATHIALSGAIAEKTIGELLDSGKLITSESLETYFDKVDQRLYAYEYWLEVQQEHPDALKIKTNPEFKEWLKKESEAIQTLATSVDPQDTIKFLNYYKEEQAKAAVATKDSKDKSTKKKKDDLHKHSARTKTQVSGGERTGDEDDEEAGWELGGKV